MRILSYPRLRIAELCLLAVLCIKCSGQVEQYSADTAALNKLYAAAQKQVNTDTLILLYRQMLALAIETKNDSVCNGFSLKLGEFYIRNGDYVQALSYTRGAFVFNSLLSAADRSNDYLHLGWVYFNAGAYVDASENFYQALYELKKDPVAGKAVFPMVYRMLGMVHTRLHQDAKALYYFNLAESTSRKNGYKNLIALIQLCKGEYYTDKHRLDSAGKCFREVVDIAEKTQRPDIKAEAYEGLGKAYIEARDYGKAIHYLRWVAVNDRLLDMMVATDASYYLGEALYRLKKYNDAENVLVAAIRMASTARLADNVIMGYATLAAVYKATGQYARALACMDTLLVLKDSLVSVEKAQAINLMDIRYQTIQKDKEIANSQLLIARQNSKIARKNMWMSIIGAGILLLSAVAAGVYVHAIIRQRSLEKENKIRVLKAAIQGEDNERARLARELHDGVGGMLSAAIMRFSAIHAGHAAAAYDMPEYAEVTEILRGISDEIRKTAHNLMPDVLLKQSLPDAIRAYCNSLHANDLQLNFQHYGTFDDMPQNYKLNIYRIIQELVKNIIKHSGASCALVQLLRNKNTVIVSVEDNGAGFDAAAARKGQGLHNARTRVRSIDGLFTLETQPGKGTSVFIEFNSIPHLYQPQKSSS